MSRPRPPAQPHRPANDLPSRVKTAILGVCRGECQRDAARGVRPWTQAHLSFAFVARIRSALPRGWKVSSAPVFLDDHWHHTLTITNTKTAPYTRYVFAPPSLGERLATESVAPLT